MKPMYVWMVLASIFIKDTLGYRILAVIPFSGKSHYISIQPILQELAIRGHDVTVITAHREENPPKNYHQIVVTKRLLWEFLGDAPDIFALEKLTFQPMLNLVWDGAHFTTEVALNSSSLAKFIKEDNSHYDLIFQEIFFQESLYMFAHKYKAPMVAFCTMGYTQFIGDTMGSPVVLPYMVHEFLNFGSKMTMTEKFINVYSTLYDLFWRHFYLLPRHQKLAEKHFGHLPGPLPSIRELQNNISLIMLNTHYSYDLVRPYVPGIVEVGGSHIKPPKKLPMDIQKFLDNAKDGAIYFSLGSNVQSKDMPKEKVDIFLKAFGRLKHKVLWKWEDEQLAGKPANVMTGKWLPQNDILAHPNVKLFITHGGLLSTQEAIYHGVPVIGLPFYGDQKLNIEKVVSTGFGIRLEFAELTDADLSQALNEILSNPKYKSKAEDLSVRFRDRPMSAMDTAIFWIEYIARHKGAKFMKSPISEMSYFEYFMMDLLFVFVIIIFVAVTLLKKLVRKATRTLKFDNKTIKNDFQKKKLK